ncbi:MAG: PEP-CTERM sorting domain-containing protein [Phycisphaerae bacterium]
MLATGAVALGLSIGAFAQLGTGFTITDGDVVFSQGNSPTVNTSTGATGANFRVNGAAGTDHLFQNWWWFRANDETRESAFFNATGTVAAGNTATTSWTFPLFNAALTYVATDTGLNVGQVTETMVITNTSPAELRLNLYNYTDYDVAATAGSDSAVLSGAGLMTITDGPWTAQFGAAGASAYQVTSFATVRGLLANALVDNLNNTGLPFGPGDFTGAFQWTLTIPGGGTATFSERLAIVPEPSALALLAIGGLAFIRRR